MHSLFTLISLVASACAYQITSPNNVSGWTTGGPNTLAWQRVDTDPTNFTLLLVNQDKSALPTGQEILVAQVDGTTGSLTVPAPSSGFPVGSGYQVNFVKDPQDLNTILAQSNQFNITSSTGTTTTSQSNTAVTPAAATTAAQTTDTSGNGASTGGDLNPTSSSTNTSSSKNGADRVTAAGGTSLIFAALAAFIL